MAGDGSGLRRPSRADLTRAILDLVDDDVALVAGIGNAGFDLRGLAGERGLNFYMLGSMGQAISIGLGLSIAQPERRVVVMEGEGSVLLNMSALATIGLVAPPNLTVVVWDNEQWQITGGQPTATASTCNLAVVARGCGIESSSQSSDSDDFTGALRYALDAPGPHVIVAKIDSAGASSPHRDDPVAIKHQFMAALGVVPD
jgi:thiamine pyrophosphate-dependent acetolactate synthase large subunit-like protein